ncbi:Protein kinase domain-containing protein [Streptomyces sp. di188]|nr:Protein kinase domain-containing protein [Streptomyces sp. di188]
MFDFRYLSYCGEETPFYDRPVHRAAEQDFPLGHTDVPPEWWRESDDEWVFLTPKGHRLPAQGWKVHVSATLENSADTLAVIWEYCRRERLPFKFIRGTHILHRRNGKYGDRSSSGKFATLYPDGEQGLERVLDGLGRLLDGRSGPYILSDLRWRSGPLYVRYGGFLMTQGRTPSGELVPCITDPDGRLVPDERRPGFHPPAWVPVPEFLAPAVAARRKGTLKDFPFRVHHALHFSNGGGVYQATDTRTGDTVLLKEARPMAGLDSEGRDAVERLRRERWAMDTLAGIDGVPAVIDVRVGHEHHFLAREFVTGRPLSEVVAERNPVLRDRLAHGDEAAAYTDWALDVLNKIDKGITAMHDRGVTFNDLHPGNVLVTDDDAVHFIDFEAASPVGEPTGQTVAAPGFSAPAGYTGTDADRYSFGCLALAMFLPHTILAAWGQEKTEHLIRLVSEAFPVPDHFLAQVRGSLNRVGGGSRRKPRALAAGCGGRHLVRRASPYGAGGSRLRHD